MDVCYIAHFGVKKCDIGSENTYLLTVIFKEIE